MAFSNKIRMNVKECTKQKDKNWLLCYFCVDYGICKTYREHTKAERKLDKGIVKC